MHVNAITREIVDASFCVHSRLGPGLLESANKACLAYELRKRGLEVETEVPLPLVYDGLKLEVGFRIDLLVEDEVIVEVKAVSKIAEIHDAQLLSHLVLSKRRVGLRINFHCRLLKDGIRRMVNGL